MEKQITKTRSAITSVIGFWLGGLLGNFGVYLIAISGIIGWLLGFDAATQPLVRLLSAILLAITNIGLGGAISGVINRFALALHRPAIMPFYELAHTKGLLCWAACSRVLLAVLTLPTSPSWASAQNRSINLLKCCANDLKTNSGDVAT